MPNAEHLTPSQTSAASNPTGEPSKPKREDYAGLMVWDANEVAGRLGVSRSQLHRMVLAGGAPERVRLSAGRWGWVRDSVLQWLEGRTERVA